MIRSNVLRFALMLFSLWSCAGYAFDVPQLYISYGSVFDRQCSQLSKYRIQSEWVQEARRRNSEFQDAWNVHARDLLTTLFTEIGKGFSRKELSVTTSVCNYKSMSIPIMINVRRWLNSYSAPSAPAPMIGFAEFVFHEFLHNYVVENLRKPSPLLEKYKGEGFGVRAHLHLMALEKFVFLKLGRQDLLAWAEGFYKMVGGDYARSWEIVTKSDDYLKFIDEMKAR